MTVITKPLSQDRKSEKNGGLDADVTVEVTTQNGSDRECDVIAPYLPKRPYWRMGVPFQLLGLISLLIIITAVMLIGLHTYLSLGHRSYLRGVCSIPYPVRATGSDTLITGAFGHSSSKEINARNAFERLSKGDTDSPFLSALKKVLESRRNSFINLVDSKQNGGIAIDFELDLDYGEVEWLQLPEISRGTYLHDFKVNKTAIVDILRGHCFVFPLDRQEISPPRSLYDVLAKMKNGAYGLDIKQIRRDFRVIAPPLSDLSDYGVFIQKSCHDKMTFRLEEMSLDSLSIERNGQEKILVKRSTSHKNEEAAEPFIEYAGQSIIKYHIAGLEKL